MSRVQPHQLHSGKFQRDGRSSYTRTSNMGMSTNAGANYICNYDYHAYNTKLGTKNQESYCFSQNYGLDGRNYDCAWPDSVPSSKKRKISALSCESTGRPYQHQYTYQNDLVNHADQRKPLGDYNTYYDAHLIRNSSAVVETRSNNASVYASTTSKRDRSKFEDDEVVFMSRDEIERCSPSRKDGIDPLHETYLRYTYCAFLQNLGVSLDLPQTTIGTAMVLCHRFFVRRSHASHDRFLIATAVLFLASKSEETPCLLNDVIRLSGQILQKQDVTLLSYKLPTGWFEQYRERITEAEQLILTTLNFELNVQHPFESLNSTLQKLGFQQSVLVNLALSLVGEGIKDSIGSTCGMTTETLLEIKDYWLLYELINLQEPMPAIFEQDDKLRSSLWLQFKPHQIAAGAAYLAAKFLNMNLASCHDVWHEFHTTPSVLKDVAHQLMELF